METSEGSHKADVTESFHSLLLLHKGLLPYDSTTNVPWLLIRKLLEEKTNFELNLINILTVELGQGLRAGVSNSMG